MSHSVRRLNALASYIHAKRYLEIGVSTGSTFLNIDVAHKTAVDPYFRFDTSAHTNETTRFCPSGSDEFFTSEELGVKYDLIFIDGLHAFEQVVRDFSSAVACMSERSAILIDDTVPSDPFSAIADPAASARYRKVTGNPGQAWHGDVFKIVFYIHDFWPLMDYRTFIGSGNPQTLVWRSKGAKRTHRFNNLESISRLTFFDLQDNSEIMKYASEEEAMRIFMEQNLKT